QILLLTQTDPAEDEPGYEDLYHVGCVANVMQLLKLPDGTVKVLVEGQSRAKVVDYSAEGEFHQATVEELQDERGDTEETAALMRAVVDQFREYVKLNKKVAPEVVANIEAGDDEARLADTIS